MTNKELLDQIKKIDWFSNCGNEIFVHSQYKIQKFKSIEEVKKSINSIAWENTTLNASNNLSSYLDSINSREATNWNKTIENIKNELLFLEDVAQIFSNKYDFDIIDDLKWNFLMILTENHLKNIERKVPLFFNNLLEIYKAGNLPCGYKGKDIKDLTSIIYYW